ncbi:FadR/GntR family transcriptional regulator [uncultured Vagococcus sp.]|uniref:FadR/GntR family transcriptional regulator n=1 Tax=uncultured Vagococcus sp. TaxID=189676 RepID=UPI0028D380AD|nr:FadR/GntR family transcriptional regulator [uncultured Vagococcus sp.]
MKKPRRVSLSTQIVQELTKKIETGDWPIQTKIPTEAQLTEQFEVSRNTVREALQSLIQAGLLESKAGDGTYVIAANKFEANMYHELGKADYQEIAEARQLLEKNLAFLAAKKRTEEDLIAMEVALERRNNPAFTLEELALKDIDYHIEIAKAAHNSIMLDVYQSISTYLFQLIFDHMQQDVTFNHDDSQQLHIELFDAIKARDSKLAETIVGKISSY